MACHKRTFSSCNCVLPCELLLSAPCDVLALLSPELLIPSLPCVLSSRFSVSQVEGRASAMEGTEAMIKQDLEHKVLRLRELHRHFPSLRKMNADGTMPPASPRMGLGGLGFFSGGHGGAELAQAVGEWKHLHEEVPLMREQLMWTQMSLTKSRQRLPELYQVRPRPSCLPLQRMWTL